jgi:hypothetical protein
MYNLRYYHAEDFSRASLPVRPALPYNISDSPNIPGEYSSPALEGREDKAKSQNGDSDSFSWVSTSATEISLVDGKAVVGSLKSFEGWRVKYSLYIASSAA